MTLDDLRQSFSNNFLGSSNENEFIQYLKTTAKTEKSGKKLAEATIKNVYNLGKDFFRLLFDINIFEIQLMGIEFLTACQKEMEKGGCLYEINYNDGRKPFYNPNYTQFNGHPISCLKFYIKFLQQKGVDSKENEPATEKDSSQNKGDTMNDKTKIPPLNQILYGPPGTGKTYSTIDKALEILGYAESSDNGKAILDYTKIKQKLQNIVDNKKGAGLDLKNLNSKNDRELAKLLFDYYRSAEQGQIKFITFHQSFSYEEFVEGIKPKFVKKSKNPSNETETKSKEMMIYKVKSGIFKKICKKAFKNCDSSNKITLQKIQERIKSNPCVWKASLEQTDSELYKYCLKNNEIRIGFQHDGGDKNASVRHFRDEMQKGDIVGIRHDDQSFNAIGVIVGDCDEKNIDERATITKTYPITRKIKWILIDNVKNIQDKKLDRNTVYQLDTTAKDLFVEIQDRVGYVFDDLPNQITCKDLPKKPYILIIDEINRGNISKILGELITLIEPSKRIGSEEELRVTLPYSNDEFGVPSNLYIIGTMNTADRSIALLDTALRRRFEFIEMMPNAELLGKIEVENSEIDLQKLLIKMNERIEFLLDREHTIGHSFFIGVGSLDKLREVFKLKIIPLLQEYFYDDYAKIDAVLNYNKMVESKSMSDLGVTLSDDFVDSEKRVYRITDSSAWDATTFTKIYE